MATKVLVPRLGEGVDEVTVTKWLKQVGDSIKELEPLLEVNTDKVDTEIPAPASGVILRIDMQEGQVGKVGELLAIIGVAGETVDSGQSTVSSEKPAPEAIPAKEPATTHHPLRPSPTRSRLHLPRRCKDRRRAWRGLISSTRHRHEWSHHEE
jgi:pyruvate dehydrogenase E2 component (dihydrolipoamide acetyltransferase)